MRKKSPLAKSAMIALLCAAASAAFGQAPSTPEERTRLVTLTHKLESNPLDPKLRSEREWAIKWLIEVPDIHVGMCPTILGDYHKYKYSSEITTQLMLAGAEFAIENPDQAKDQSAQYVAAAESALKAYSAILQQDPKARSKPLDEVVQRQSEGKLKESVQDAANKTCRN
ncbi:MAG TPA: hypothetical protein VK812_18010 [Candidatus Binatus sp.]|jgi:hypothetical protein|nr:hypothetical protein [Candidatus Binatus sp.]